MIGANQPLFIWKSVPGVRDTEGRPTRDYMLTAAVVGNLICKQARELVDGSWQQVDKWIALLPADLELNHQDIIKDGSDQVFRVETVTARRGPLGDIHHLSCQLVRAGA